MGITKRFETCNAFFACSRLGFVFGHLELTAAHKAAVMADVFFHTMPDAIPGGESKRDFGQVTPQGAHTTGIQTRSVPPTVIGFQQPDPPTTPRKMHGRR